MLVSRIMRSPVTTVPPEISVRAAAALMGALGLGALPVCRRARPVGIITDRDIVTRWLPNAFAEGPVAPIMTPDVVTCRADCTVERAAYLMADRQIRRLVVVDAAGDIVGMVTLGDIANDASEQLAGQTLGEIVETRLGY